MSGQACLGNLNYMDIINFLEILRCQFQVFWKISKAYGNWQRHPQTFLNHFPSPYFRVDECVLFFVCNSGNWCMKMKIWRATWTFKSCWNAAALFTWKNWYSWKYYHWNWKSRSPSALGRVNANSLIRMQLTRTSSYLKTCILLTPSLVT